VLPITAPGIEKNIAGVLIVGVNPRRPYDSEYKRFMDLVASHVSSALSFAWVYPLSPLFLLASFWLDYDSLSWKEMLQYWQKRKLKHNFYLH
jgi:hypothetical protein